MAGTRHGMCELTARYGWGTAWARHAMCESTSKPVKTVFYIKEVAVVVMDQ